MVKAYLLYWDENNKPDIEIIIKILKRNHQDKDSDGLVLFAGLYSLTDNFAQKLNDKGYAVKPNTEYIALMQEQPYKEILCIFGYDDYYRKQYTAEELTEIEKMKAIPMEQEFEYPELLEIEKDTKGIELRNDK